MNLSSPKTYIFGTDDHYKRSLKGVRRDLRVLVDEYRQSLYSPEPIRKTYSKLQFLKKPGTVSLIKTSKKALNSVYTKFYVSDNLVDCQPFD